MATQRVRKMLDFIRGNIRSGASSFREARAFIAGITNLSRMERAVLDMALYDRKQLEELTRKLPVKEERDKPIPRLPVATMRICGSVRPSDGQQLSAG
jgi:hypothetical protein